MHRNDAGSISAWRRMVGHMERAASLVEYALLLVLIALAMVAAVKFLGDSTSSSLDSSARSLFS
jgi:Flp pilus assembly pilin Flp